MVSADPATPGAAAQIFDVGAPIMAVEPYGSGNVNDTYRVQLQAGGARYFILQRINTHVFRHPETIMHNMRTFTEHVHQRLAREPSLTENGRRWETPHIIVTRHGKDFHTDDNGHFWRAISYIERGQTYDHILHARHAQEAGYALGRFQSLISDLPVERLYDTLEGFHITPRYLAHYDQVVAQGSPHADTPQVRAQVSTCHAFVQARRDWASVLEEAAGRGELVPRPIHGDPKINNFVIDNTTGHAVSLIDLDTVKPGLIHYDIGDCLRSCCNPAGEETVDLGRVDFDLDLCRAILEGYLSAAHSFLQDADYHYLYDCVRLIAFELGLRFFTDYLEGDKYFKVKHDAHNLMRSMVQFRVVEAVEGREKELRSLIEELRRAYP